MPERHRKELVGVVLSDKMKKSIVVQVTRLVQHPVFKKVIKQKSKFVAHDEKQVAKVRDRVRISETRPVSKTKRWRLVEILSSSRSA